MKVRVQYTAQLRTAVGLVEENVEPSGDGSPAELFIRLATELHREAAPFVSTLCGELQPSLLIGMNGQGASPREARNVQLRDGDVVTLMPPIAGG